MLLKQISLIVGAVLALALPALAHDEGHGDRPHYDSVCVSGCRTDFQDCQAAARTERRTCVDSCSALVEAARAACGDAEHGVEPSAECAAARSAAHDCLKPCREAYHDDRDACVASLRQCVGACPVAETTPTPVDRACLGECRHDRNACYEAAREAATACAAGCADEAQAVVDSCGRRPRDGCRAAREALAVCLQPCRAAARVAVEACMNETTSCVEACRAATPSPTPEPAG